MIGLANCILETPSGIPKPRRILRLPPPPIATHLVDAARRLPAQDHQRQRRVCVHAPDVTWPSRHDLVRHLPPARLLERANHVEHAVALAGAEVDREQSAGARAFEAALY